MFTITIRTIWKGSHEPVLTSNRSATWVIRTQEDIAYYKCKWPPRRIAIRSLKLLVELVRDTLYSMYLEVWRLMRPDASPKGVITAEHGGCYGDRVQTHVPGHTEGTPEQLTSTLKQQAVKMSYTSYNVLSDLHLDHCTKGMCGWGLIPAKTAISPDSLEKVRNFKSFWVRRNLINFVKQPQQFPYQLCLLVNAALNAKHEVAWYGSVYQGTYVTACLLTLFSR